MSSDERKDREDRGWEALIVACFLKGLTGPDAYDDPGILSEEDRRVMESIAPDVVERIALAAMEGQIPSGLESHGYIGVEGTQGGFLPGPPVTGIGFDIAALHRGDEKLTPEALEEMKRRTDELLGNSEGPEG
jgi:hypothetical protein